MDLRREIVEIRREATEELRVGFDTGEMESRFEVLKNDAERSGVPEYDLANFARMRLVAEAYRAGQRRFYGPLCDALSTMSNGHNVQCGRCGRNLIELCPVCDSNE